jgi:16S rRNA (guanine527-N7)-methyltransferase
MSAISDYRALLVPHVEPGAVEPLARYAEILERWSKRHNLVRFANREELVTRHLVDALAGAPLFTGAGRLLDVGSGAGLPGVPLLAACPRWSGVLLEPRQKRWAFLRTVIRELGLAATVERARYQDFGGNTTFDRITARALGGYPELISWSRLRLAPGGEVLVWTTVDGVAELEMAKGWRVLSSPLPDCDRGRLARLQPCFT